MPTISNCSCIHLYLEDGENKMTGNNNGNTRPVAHAQNNVIGSVGGNLTH